MSPPADAATQKYRYCLDAHGRRIELSAGRWHGEHSYASTWEVCGALADQLCVNEQMQEQAGEQFLIWNPAAEPGSDAESRMLLGMQMTVAAVSLRHLAAATVVRCGADAAGAELVWSEQEQSTAFALAAELPASPVYLDFTAVNRKHSAALEIGGRTWPLTGALCHHAGGCLIVVPFSAPAAGGVPGPAGQPLARVLYGPADRLPHPNPGDVCINADGLYITPAVAHPDSEVTARLNAAVELSGAVLCVLRRLSDPELLVAQAPASRPVRRAAARAGQRLSWSVAPAASALAA